MLLHVQQEQAPRLGELLLQRQESLPPEALQQLLERLQQEHKPEVEYKVQLVLVLWSHCSKWLEAIGDAGTTES